MRTLSDHIRRVKGAKEEEVQDPLLSELPLVRKRCLRFEWAAEAVDKLVLWHTALVVDQKSRSRRQNPYDSPLNCQC